MQVECGFHHTVVLTLTDGVLTFGWDHFGQLGHKRELRDKLHKEMVDKQLGAKHMREAQQALALKAIETDEVSAATSSVSASISSVSTSINSVSYLLIAYAGTEGDHYYTHHLNAAPFSPGHFLR
jgi:alpha-tubulin suppressor-like RCC1 family protein